MLNTGVINYIGYVGFKNLGDESLFEANTTVFKPYHLIPQLNEKHSNVTLFGGGTTFPIWPSKTFPTKYNYAYGVGVRDPSFWATRYSYAKFQFWFNRLKQYRFRFIGVRDIISQRLLEHWNIKSTIIGDPCLLLKTRPKTKMKRRIAINIGSDGIVWGLNEKRAFSELAKFCVDIKKEGWTPIFIPFNQRDLTIIKKITEKINAEYINNFNDIETIINCINSCYMLIGERLHSLVFSSAVHTPFISLEYRPKCYNFAQTVGFKQFNIRLDNITSKNIMSLFTTLLENWDEMHKRLIKNTNFLRTRLLKSAQLIKNDLDNLPEDKWDVPQAQIMKRFYTNATVSFSNVLFPLYDKILRRRCLNVRPIK